MPTRVYKSTDPGAPTLNGQVGSLIRVLRACLVDGFGSLPPLGWSMPYTDGNNPPLRAHFRQAPKTGWDQYDLEVKDDGSTSLSASDPRLAEAWGWGGAAGLAGGSVAFPVRTSPGMLILKSETSNATARRWLLVGTDRSFIFVAYHLANPNNMYAAGPWFFGDTIPIALTDTWAVALSGGTVSDASPGIARLSDDGYVLRVMPYTFQGMPGPTTFSRVWPAGVATGDVTVGNGSIVYPNGPDGRGYIDRILLTESGHLRAVLPGFWVPLHNWKSAASIYDWQTFDGAGDLAGRSFIVAKWGSGGTGNATVTFCIETSDTWYVL
jgi:hypothetical protein